MFTANFYKYPLFLNKENCTVNEKVVLTLMYDFLEKAMYKNQYNFRKEYYVTVCIENIAKKVGLSRQTVSKILGSLEKKNYFKKEKIVNTLSYRYYLLDNQGFCYHTQKPFCNTKYIKFYDFLFKEEYRELSLKEKLLATFLYDTDTLSAKKAYYQTAQGAFVIKKQKEAAELLACSLRTVASCFKKLVEKGFLFYKRIGKTLANHIYCLKEKIQTNILKNKFTENFKVGRLLATKPKNSSQNFYFLKSDMQNLKSDMQKFNIYKTKNIRLRLVFRKKEKIYSLTKDKLYKEDVKVLQTKDIKEPIVQKLKSNLKAFIQDVHHWWTN